MVKYAAWICVSPANRELPAVREHPLELPHPNWEFCKQNGMYDHAFLHVIYKATMQLDAHQLLAVRIGK